MARHCVCVLLVPLFALGCSAGSATSAPADSAQTRPAPPPIQPEFSEAVLEFGGRSVRPAHLQQPFQPTFQADGLHVRVFEDTILAERGPDRAVKWRLQTADKLHLHWLAAGGGVGYLAAYEPNRDDGSPPYEAPAQLRRVHLAEGRWLPPVKIGDLAAPDAKRAQFVIAAIAGATGLFALREEATREEDWPHRWQMAKYAVLCVDHASGKVRWTRSFAAHEPQSDSGPWLWSSTHWGHGTGYAEPGVRQLQFHGEGVLVCAGPRQDILCLRPEDGTSLWEMPRIWEFERGFVGPSVWQHFIGRSRPLAERSEEKQATEKKADEQAEAQPSCAILGGPIVADHCIYVAVSQSPPGWMGAYVADCRIYEVHAGAYDSAVHGALLASRPASQPELRWAEVATITKIPRLVQGSAAAADGSSVVWACQEGALLRMAPTETPLTFGMGVGGPDLIGRLEWYRQDKPFKPEAWFQAGPYRDPIAFGGRHLFRQRTGGFVLQKKDQLYQFPIEAVDIKTGLPRVMLLKVPFRGDLPRPESNYWGSPDRSGPGSWGTFGPHQLAITWLRAEGDSLEVVLGMKGSTVGLTFDLGPFDLTGGKRGPATRPAP